MEGLTRLVSESLARHGFDRPLDYRRLQWSRWFRCDSHHSLLFVPSKPGVFALAEEVMDFGQKNDYVETPAKPALSVVEAALSPRSEASGCAAVKPKAGSRKPIPPAVCLPSPSSSKTKTWLSSSTAWCRARIP